MINPLYNPGKIRDQLNEGEYHLNEKEISFASISCLTISQNNFYVFSLKFCLKQFKCSFSKLIQIIGSKLI